MYCSYGNPPVDLQAALCGHEDAVHAGEGDAAQDEGGHRGVQWHARRQPARRHRPAVLRGT